MSTFFAEKAAPKTRKWKKKQELTFKEWLERWEKHIKET
jgi:hypothetical protein